MQLDTGVTDIVHVIQLAVAPVFLLSGVGVTLTVLTNRLARIIDRARVLEARLPAKGDAAGVPIQAELGALSLRARLIHRAITLSTTCALLICGVIVSLFLGALLETDPSGLIIVLFIVGMVAFIGALISFLREIFLATASLRFGQADH